MTCPHCAAPVTAEVVRCAQCGALLPIESGRRYHIHDPSLRERDRFLSIFVLLFTLATTLLTVWYFGWPWAIAGTWAGFLLASLLCRYPLGSNFLATILSLATTCVIGPIETFLLLPTPWRWLGVLWLVGSLVMTIRISYQMGFIRK